MRRWPSLGHEQGRISDVEYARFAVARPILVVDLIVQWHRPVDGAIAPLWT